MEMQLSQQKIRYSRTPGVICDDFHSYPIVTNIEIGSARHKGTVGCFLAHKNALREIAESECGEEDLALVLEDDVVLTNEFWRFLEENEFPTDAEILFFNATMQYAGKPRPPRNHKDLYRIDRGHPMFAGAFAYAIKKSKAREITEKMESPTTYGDVDCDFYYPNFRCYTLLTKELSLKRFVSDRHPEADFNEGRQYG